MLSETVQEVSVPKTGFLFLRLLNPEKLFFDSSKRGKLPNDEA